MNESKQVIADDLYREIYKANGCTINDEAFVKKVIFDFLTAQEERRALRASAPQEAGWHGDQMRDVLEFLNSIEGAGYGGMASFEVARAIVRDAALSAPPSVALEAAGCDWPNEPFTFRDEPGEHDPCYVVMPGGAMLALNHHTREGVDIARAKFIVAACNAALSAGSH